MLGVAPTVKNGSRLRLDMMRTGSVGTVMADDPFTDAVIIGAADAA